MIATGHYFVKKINIRVFCILSAIWVLPCIGACQSGESECMGNNMRICSKDGYWEEVACPSKLTCSKDSESISCDSKSKKLENDDEPSGVVIDQAPAANTQSSDIEINSESNPDEATKPSKHKPTSSSDHKKSRTRTVTVTKPLKDKHISSSAKSRTARKTSTGKEMVSQSTVTVINAPKEIDFELITPSSGGMPIRYSVVINGSTMISNPIVEPTSNVKPDTLSPGVSGITPTQSTTPQQPTGAPPQQPIGASPQQLTGTPKPSPAPEPSAPPQQPTGTPKPSPAPAPSAPSQQPTGAPKPSPAPAPSAPSQQPTGTPKPSPAPAPSAPSQQPTGAPKPSPAPGDSKEKPAGGTPSSAPSDSKEKPAGAAPSSGGGGELITAAQITKVCTSNGYSPNPSYVDTVAKETNSHFKDKETAAMFLAQLAHESGGFAHLEEIACENENGCPGQYGTGASGKSYHGRGFIQLSWPENYKKASEALGLGDKLYNNPDLVAKDLSIAMKVSIWFWENRVVTAPGFSSTDNFGLTTKAINGELECKNNSNIDKSKKRYKLYLDFSKEMGISKPASEAGCYTI